MEFARLAHHFERLEGTSGRLEMTGILVELLDEASQAELEPVAHLLRGALAPDWEGIEFGLAEKTILKVLASVSGAGLDAVTRAYHDAGDLGQTAESLLANRSRRQATLFTSAQDVGRVVARLREIAIASGPGSQEKKQRLLGQLLEDVSPLEARYVTRTVAGRLRLGVADMTFLDALAAWHVGDARSVTALAPEVRAARDALRALLDRAYDATSDLARVAVALAEGPDAVSRLRPAPGTPLRPMAAERTKQLAEVLERHGGKTALEYKYDGLRMQVHVGREVRIYSRRLEDLTAQFPDVVAAMAPFAGRDLIVEGEAVAFDQEGQMRPFQDLSRRRGRKEGVTARSEAGLDSRGQQASVIADLPVTLILFDALVIDGEDLTGRPYHERRKRLAELDVRLSTMEVVTSVDAMEAFFEKAVEAGAEGMMCKDLLAPYRAGSRGYHWIKYKTDYTEALVDTMDLVVVGAFYGRGRRAGWYGAFLMAARGEDGRLRSVCKLGTGFDDVMLAALHERLSKAARGTAPEHVESGLVPDVWFDPTEVFEVQAAELTLSPVHRAGWARIRADAGIAARFPRFTRVREDKGPDQATSEDEIVRMYDA